MLPDPKNLPAGCAKSRAHALIPLPIRLYLLVPEGAILGWKCRVDGAAMPEAAIDVHGELESSEDDVGLRAEVPHWSEINAIAIPPSVQNPADRHLGGRVPLSRCLHARPDRRRWRFERGWTSALSHSCTIAAAYGRSTVSAEEIGPVTDH